MSLAVHNTISILVDSTTLAMLVRNFGSRDQVKAIEAKVNEVIAAALPVTGLIFKTSDRNNIDSVFSSVGVFPDSDDYGHKCWGWHLVCINACCKFEQVGGSFVDVVFTTEFNLN